MTVTLSDQRGSGSLLTLILVGGLVLGAVVGLKSLRGQVGAKLECTGDAVASMTAGLGGCAAAPPGAPAQE